MASLAMASTALRTPAMHPTNLHSEQRSASGRCSSVRVHTCPVQDLKGGLTGLVAPARLAARHSSIHRSFSARHTGRTPGSFKTVAAAASVATKLTWQELHGSKDWAGLLEVPGKGGQKLVHSELVKEIIKYGELTQATYDGFIPDLKDDTTGYGGQNMYTRKELLDKSLPADSLARKENYQVLKYMHSSSGLASLFGKDSKIFKYFGEHKDRNVWAGYVGYKVIDSSAKIPEIEIVVAFRGTILLKEWASNALGAFQHPWLGYGEAKVHNGFQEIYRDDPELKNASDEKLGKYKIDNRRVAAGSPQDVVHKCILELASKYKVRNIVTVGHSLGAALATICALDVGQFIKDDPLGKKAFPADDVRPTVNAFVFASPRVGDKQFLELFSEYNVKVFRTTDVPDIVPKVPGYLDYEDEDAVKTGLMNYLVNSLLEFVDNKVDVLTDWEEVGTEVKVDYRKSKILKSNWPISFSFKLFSVTSALLGMVAIILGRYHNNEVHLYLIATQLGGHPEPTVGVEPGPGERHYKLCNKSDNVLIPEFSDKRNPPIPPNWWANRPEKGSGIPSSDREDR